MTLEDPEFTWQTKYRDHARALKLIKNVLEYCDKNPNSSFDGIHINTEPHALPEYSARALTLAQIT